MRSKLFDISQYQWIGRENLQETPPILWSKDVKSIQKHGFRFRFSRINQSIDSIYLNYGMLLLDIAGLWGQMGELLSGMAE
jgi:hypothetical protein